MKSHRHTLRSLSLIDHRTLSTSPIPLWQATHQHNTEQNRASWLLGAFQRNGEQPPSPLLWRGEYLSKRDGRRKRILSVVGEYYCGYSPHLDEGIRARGVSANVEYRLGLRFHGDSATRYHRIQGGIDESSDTIIRVHRNLCTPLSLEC